LDNTGAADSDPPPFQGGDLEATDRVPVCRVKAENTGIATVLFLPLQKNNAENTTILKLHPRRYLQKLSHHLFMRL